MPTKTIIPLSNYPTPTIEVLIQKKFADLQKKKNIDVERWVREGEERRRKGRGGGVVVSMISLGDG